ncbi:MAG: winged helix-turn-helix transcriptional regulator [Clostridium sp.]|nr:winged helix-turn-helix transcriptional regulator [Clostridium sp.]
MLDTNFKILREIKNNNQVTQRELARKVSVSLGKVNSLLKEYSDLGYINKLLEGKKVKYEITELGESVLVDGLDIAMETRISINEENDIGGDVNYAVILAAGRQKDFNTPTSSLMIGECSIIERTVKMLKSAGIENIVVIVGYKSNILIDILSNYDNINFVYNDEYETSGTMKSLSIIKEVVKNDFLLIESDLLFEEKALNAVLEADSRDCVLITELSGIGDEAFVEIRNNYVYKISKDIHQFNRVDGELIGLTKISFNLFNLMLREFELNENRLVNYEYILLDVSRKYDIGYVKINDLIWGEIDNMSQYEKAKKKFITYC